MERGLFVSGREEGSLSVNWWVKGGRLVGG